MRHKSFNKMPRLAVPLGDMSRSVINYVTKGSESISGVYQLMAIKLPLPSMLVTSD